LDQKKNKKSKVIFGKENKSENNKNKKDKTKKSFFKKADKSTSKAFSLSSKKKTILSNQIKSSTESNTRNDTTHHKKISKKSTIKQNKSKHSYKKKKAISSRKKTTKKHIRNQYILTDTFDQKLSFTLSEDELNKLKQEIYKRDGIKKIEEWTEIDAYPLREPFVFASILQNNETKEKRYFLIEILLTKEEQHQLSYIKETYEIMPSDTNDIIEFGEEKILNYQVNEIIQDYSLEVSPSSKNKIFYYLKKDFLGLGSLEPVMRDVNIEDVSCDGASVPLFLYHRTHGSIQSNISFPDEEELASFVMKLAQKCGKHISISNPMLDATMPDGSRIQMTLSTEVSTKGSTFTIRKFKEQPFSPADLIRFNTMSPEMMSYLWLAVQYGHSALISGGTASGKTSLLNAISLFIPRESKIVSIEETREINLPHPNWIPGVSRSGFGGVVGGKLTGEIDLYDLMKAALRQRPEYIIVGEIRGKEAYVLFQAMATGHTTYSTVHADSTKSLIHRLEGEPINIPRIMLQSLDIVCIQSIARVKNKRVRRCKQIIEIIDIDPTTKEILTNEVFRWDPIRDTYYFSGKSYILEQIRVKTDMKQEDIKKELKQRSDVLSWMVDEKIYRFDDVAKLTANYLERPEELTEKILVKQHE
jgi:flagellar protein FlaI